MHAHKENAQNVSLPLALRTHLSGIGRGPLLPKEQCLVNGVRLRSLIGLLAFELDTASRC